VIRILPLLLLAGCATNAHGDRYGDSRFTLSGAECEWMHRDGDRFHAVWVEAHRAAGDLIPRHKERKRVEVCFEPGPFEVWGILANGTGRSTMGTSTLIVRGDLPEAATERLVLHELLHQIGGDRLHEDPAWWQPHPESVEARATCALQPEHCP
jgi:hypothetical protein